MDWLLIALCYVVAIFFVILPLLIARAAKKKMKEVPR